MFHNWFDKDILFSIIKFPFKEDLEASFELWFFLLFFQFFVVVVEVTNWVLGE